MSKDKQWNGLQLLSFDLQTVEFAYAEVRRTLALLFLHLLTLRSAIQDYAVSISVTDQLTATGGAFDLRFSRCPHAPWISQHQQRDPPNINTGDLYNPHDDAEPFLRPVLQHARLAPSLQRLVSLLRETLPIAAELEEMRLQSEREGGGLDTFAKAAGWYRVLYGDLR